jgi:hypothetical protein
MDVKKQTWFLLLISLLFLSTSSYAKQDKCVDLDPETNPTCVKGKKLVITYDRGPLLGYPIEISPGKIVEVDSNNKKIKSKFKIKKNLSYSPYVLTNGVATRTLVSTDKLKNSNKIFKRTDHFGTLISSITEDVICGGCSGGTIGTCQNPASKMCASPTNGRCPRRFTKCTEQKIIEQQTILTSIALENWDLKEATTSVRYRMKFKIKSDHYLDGNDSNDVDLEEQVDELISIMPIVTTGVIVAVDGQKRVVAVNVTLSKKNRDSIVVIFEIPPFGPGEKFYYN